jgi:hypothetical protein
MVLERFSFLVCSWNVRLGERGTYWWFSLWNDYYMYVCILHMRARRSQWPRGLRRRSTAARLLRSWVRIPPGAWVFVCCVCCQVEVSATSWSVVQRSPTDCGASLYVITKPRKLGGHSPRWAAEPEKIYRYNICSCVVLTVVRLRISVPYGCDAATNENNYLTNVTPCRRDLPEKLTRSQLIKKFPAACHPRRTES